MTRHVDNAIRQVDFRVSCSLNWTLEQQKKVMWSDKFCSRMMDPSGMGQMKIWDKELNEGL